MASEDIWPRIDADIITHIKLMSLTGTDPSDSIGDRVDGLMWPDPRDGQYFPRIMVTHEGEKEELLGRENGRPGNRIAIWAYPTRVWIADIVEDRHVRKDLYLKYRKQLIDYFMKEENQVFQNVPELCGIDVIPDIVFDEQLPTYSHVQSGIILRVKTSELY